MTTEHPMSEAEQAFRRALTALLALPDFVSESMADRNATLSPYAQGAIVAAMEHAACHIVNLARFLLPPTEHLIAMVGAALHYAQTWEQMEAERNEATVAAHILAHQELAGLLFDYADEEQLSGSGVHATWR